MSEQETNQAAGNESTTENGATATATRPRTKPAPPKVDRLPPWKVLLHNDPINEMGYVARTIMELASLDKRIAYLRMLEAHTKGVALLLVTHRERAELLAEQFASKKLTVTIEAE